MRITTTVDDNVLTARIEGRLDAHTVDRYIEAVVDAVGPQTPNVELDMSAVEFMDSSALAGLVQTYKRCRESGGSLVLADVADPVRMILELTRLSEVFPQVSACGEGQSAPVGAGTEGSSC